MHRLTGEFRRFIVSEGLFAKEHRLLVAVSGGVDSVVLCHLLREEGYSFAIAHANFGLRGEESEGDETFVKDLARDLGVEVHTRKFNTEDFRKEQGLSIQEAARYLRYHWFGELLQAESKQCAFHCIVTAHHKDDQAETLLLHLLRGTGVDGLRGMLPRQGYIARPLLCAGKEELVDFAKEHNLNWREDSSNATDKYTRNFIRQRILPSMQAQFPKVVDVLDETAYRFRFIADYYHDSMARTLSKLVVHKGKEELVPVNKLATLPGIYAILYEWLSPKGFSSAQVKEVMRLMQSQTGRMVQATGHRVIRNRDWLVLTGLQQEESSLLVVDGQEGTIDLPNGLLRWKLCARPAGEIPSSPHKVWLDARELNFPLLARPWKNGDYFYPLGMPKKKKLARFLTDCKLSRQEKESTWVLEMDRKILWVIDQRIDDRFKVRSSTTEVLVLEFIAR
ncbi:tRNA lysidine(34) synthetase TilS [Flavihumibacter rivuli]|uniref:tRNA lysidine(34) synthetase TilS n=1 Tax=Flavihumibacter rivuli TaxID=2838156 RepID=UPI001BDDF0A2|nr:tRNA lysidine(34) synthetase TilS [Flavihumibacter rivuli]ULQ57402.1 tRNA lysidine(34) synthetase TilS [Flavihumibacter rivuli]